MIIGRQHFKQAPRDAIALLDRLIRICVCAHGDGRRLVARPRKLLFKKLRGIGLGEELAFEIKPWREPHIGMGRAREAVGATMLAAAIGIHRTVEWNVG